MVRPTGFPHPAIMASTGSEAKMVVASDARAEALEKSMMEELTGLQALVEQLIRGKAKEMAEGGAPPFKQKKDASEGKDSSRGSLRSFMKN